ncbi:hypothetical protein LTR05_006696 [Lithohypha guttulata]|uniref:Uncharacterized protein n=1 Tax=Lithohypha guttulata TaxID=1690604 RepID=A0AAN7SVP2_9EURO|nr:hypothetical protein LTR05_006696 [Lithohypha guttulata]
MLIAFEHNPHCPTCGLSVSEVDSKMQDELAEMLTRNMHLGVQPALDVSSPPTPQVVPQTAPTYISQHYHHSSHTVAAPAMEETQTSTILKTAGVNADALLPSQLQLFKNALPDQKERLVELWRIAPPTYGGQVSQMGNWPQTSMESEEEAAQQRWEKQEQDRLKNLSVLPSQEKRETEPYMVDEYGSSMNVENSSKEYRSATDPVHNREREWWHMAEEPMEHQYGMLQQYGMMHGFCGVEDNDNMML